MRWKIAQWFERRWWKNYLKNKPVEDYLEWKTNYWRAFSKSIGVAPAANTKVLDAGCGPAGIFTILNDQSVIAVDPLLDVYTAEIPHFEKSRYPQVNFIKSGLESINYDSTFDTVYCLNVINHVEDLPKALSNLNRALKPKGTFVLSIDSHNHQFLKKLYRLIPTIDILHPHQYDLKEYQDMTNALGLELKNTVLIKKRSLFNYYALVFEKN